MSDKLERIKSEFLSHPEQLKHSFQLVRRKVNSNNNFKSENENKRNALEKKKHKDNINNIINNKKEWRAFYRDEGRMFSKKFEKRRGSNVFECFGKKQHRRKIVLLNAAVVGNSGTAAATKAICVQRDFDYARDVDDCARKFRTICGIHRDRKNVNSGVYVTWSKRYFERCQQENEKKSKNFTCMPMERNIYFTCMPKQIYPGDSRFIFNHLTTKTNCALIYIIIYIIIYIYIYIIYIIL